MQDKREQQPMIKDSRSPSHTLPTRPVKLADIFSSYSHLLPMQVVVHEGISSSNGDWHIAQHETYNLHFLKTVKVAIVKDPITFECYSIPLNTSVKFGLIYQPAEDDENASPYMMLKTAGDVLKLKQTPHVVTATSSYNGGSPEKSVSEGEVLMVRESSGGGGGKSWGKQLCIINVSSGEEKFLGAKCSGGFSTDPRHTRMPLRKLVDEDWGILLPQYVVIYPQSREMSSMLPSSIAGSPIFLEAVKEEKSIITTRGEISNIGAGK